MQEYEYSMVPMAEEILARRVSDAANYLEEVVSENATGGWEFYRTDEFVVWRRGCLNRITLGIVGQAEDLRIYVVTFRRLKE